MIGKMITHGDDRNEAIERMKEALLMRGYWRAHHHQPTPTDFAPRRLFNRQIHLPVTG